MGDRWTGMTARVQELIDRQDIMDCLLRYTRGADRLDVDLIRSAFHEDGLDCHGKVTGTREDFLAWWLPGQEDRDATQHYLMNHTCELDGDTAHAETYFLAVVKRKDRDDAAIFGGRYVDRLERRDGAWRIAVRVVEHEWNVVGDASGMAAAMEGRHRGARDRSDPSYERPLQPRQPPAVAAAGGAA